MNRIIRTKINIDSFSSSVSSLIERSSYGFRSRVEIAAVTKMSKERMKRKTIFGMRSRRMVALKMVRPPDVLCVVPKQTEDT